ncbi:MAG: GAF domain-containing protein, partial [Chloroflexi bacterium]|nr:GAF domain-containing protein [Chloroflexota bacterium]
MGKGKSRLDTEACYQALSRIAESLHSTLPLRQALHLTVRSAARALGVSGCTLMLLDSSRKHLSPVASYGLGDWYVRKGLLDVEKSIGEILLGEPVMILDAAQDSRLQYGELARRAGIASILSVPLKQKDRVIGTIRAYSHERRRFAKAEIGFLHAVASACALALENARLLEELQGEHAA